MSRRDTIWQLSAEQLRRASAAATHQILLRSGRRLEMTLGCGYPKSGTVWLCQLISSYLGSPYPQNYLAPIAMRSVIHGHWRYDHRLPPTVYITRDGRDVMVSMYFYGMRALTLAKNPAHRQRLGQRYKAIFGQNYDPDDIHGNLPRFIEAQMDVPAAHMTWHQHVEEWHRAPNTVHIRYEGLLADSRAALAAAMTELTGVEADPELVDLAIRRHEFIRSSGRDHGIEDRTSFLRKGVAGDWRNHFGYEAGEIFDHHAGVTLVDLGYAEDRHWYRGLSR